MVQKRKKYFKKTVYRLFDNSYGIYRGKKIFEAQETVAETQAMPHKYFKYFNSTIVADFIINKTIGSKKKYYWENV